MFATVPAATVHVESGRLRALATSSPSRLPALPMVPTLSELGWSRAVMRDWHGLVAPAGTSTERLRQLSGAASNVLAQPAVVARLAAQGLAPVARSGPEEFRSWIAEEATRWADTVRRAGITLD